MRRRKRPAALGGKRIGELFGDEALHSELIAEGFQIPVREIMFQGQPFLLDVRPITEKDPLKAAGGVLTLHAPSRLGERLQALQNFDEGGFDAILGDSPAIRGLKARAARVAAVDAPLLILGETGTGKELIAHACHRASTRKGKTFLALNCAALPENLAESELFGYAPGSFTGAQRGGKPGLLELADQGTVFLDEIGEMSPYLQAKLLRFLNDGSFRRVGGDREQKVDVRIISATHRKLDQMVAEGDFREDLVLQAQRAEPSGAAAAGSRRRYPAAGPPLHRPRLRPGPAPGLPADLGGGFGAARQSLARQCAPVGERDLPGGHHVRQPVAGRAGSGTCQLPHGVQARMPPKSPSRGRKPWRSSSARCSAACSRISRPAGNWRPG